LKNDSLSVLAHTDKNKLILVHKHDGKAHIDNIVAKEIGPPNISDDKVTSSPLGGDDKQRALYLMDYDTFATA